ncbi:MAG TPA: sulfatase [Candidatus Krumholzibacteria bacterium]|nr:sulfatase [Candidatus Krumholzibacteria bacterium]
MVRSRLVLVFVVLLVACAPRVESPLPPLEDLNVLLICIDTLGAGHVGALAPEDEPGLDTTPNLDALARGGVLFTRAQAPAPWTQPSVGSLFTGLTPSHHGAIHLMDSLSDEHTTLAEWMKARGKRTGGVISHFLIDRELGYAQGFDRYDETPIAGHRGVSSREVTDRAIAQLEAMAGDSFFLFVHYFDPHNVYVHHQDFSRSDWYDGPARHWDPRINELRRRRHDMSPDDVRYFRDVYREEVAFTDHHVGRLLDAVERAGLHDDTLVIVVADHGESFMEQGWIGHTRYLYDTFVHVPMIMSLPSHLPPDTVRAPVSLVDVPVTLLDLGGEDVGSGFDGDSLVPLLAGAPESEWQRRPLFAEVSFLVDGDERDPQVIEKEAFLTAVTREDWKLIHDLAAGSWELYDRSDDPYERDDLYDPEHRMVRELRPLLQEWEEGKTATWGREFVDLDALSPEQLERLRSLGYVD